MGAGAAALGAALLAVGGCPLCGAPDVAPPCACIDPWGGLSDADRAALSASGLTVDMPSHAATNVPLTYGARGCDAYDDELAPTCRNTNGEVLLGRPEWCGTEWCFVNASACQVRRHCFSHCVAPHMHVSPRLCFCLHPHHTHTPLARTHSPPHLPE